MKKSGFGGANTKTGLEFENRASLIAAFNKTPGYSVRGDEIFFSGNKAAQSLGKHKLYGFLKKHGVDYKAILSKKLIPDEALYVSNQKRVFVIEIKFQGTTGSVDEKLQTSDFKKKQYQKLFRPLGTEVEFIYVLSEWFEKPEYRDVLNYIRSVGCHYYFQKLPLAALGLPTSKT
ncbi:MAG: hypothetical protein HYS44_01785 [Candidatus Niyogibacteria bacterium]|nr:hypothetical protein [Candidatus Niyogibacteria bacterium]